MGHVEPDLAVRLQRVAGDADDEAGLPTCFAGQKAIVSCVNGRQSGSTAAKDVNPLMALEEFEGIAPQVSDITGRGKAEWGSCAFRKRLGLPVRMGGGVAEEGKDL